MLIIISLLKQKAWKSRDFGYPWTWTVNIVLLPVLLPIRPKYKDRELVRVCVYLALLFWIFKPIAA